jgi:superfamily II RNA helicase
MADEDEIGAEEAPLARRLAELEGGEPTAERLLDAFLGHVADLGLELYPAQEEAILALLDWKHVILDTPTGSGKSLVALALHFQALAEGRVSFYTA